MTDRRILIVDDELSVRSSLEEWFREDGFVVETAEDGQAALRAMDRGPFDIVLLDLKMPGMDGIAVQKRIREIDPQTAIIILTAYASVETAVEALKLEEAFMTLLTDEERDKLVRDNMQAADLGAAPGGWTWVLVRNGMMVTSVDNGPLAQNLLDSGRVEHLRADGFLWQPKRTLDWMVCDMVEQPRRVAERMATWFQQNWCRQAIFNLKLPMKKRVAALNDALNSVRTALNNKGIRYQLESKQLYHDREEVTVYLARKR